MENSKLNGKAHGEFSVKHIGEPVLVSPEEETKKGLYFLSNIDHNIMDIVKTAYCYGADKDGRENLRKPAEVIRNSPEKVLVHHYPLAGRLIVSPEGKIMVDCNNPGVIFVEAEADCALEEIGDISPQFSKTLGKLVYDVPGVKNTLEMPPLVVQVTHFKCSGFVLGLCILHCMTDGIAAVEFVNSWSEIARGLHPTTLPFLPFPVDGRAKLTPPIPKGFFGNGIVLATSVYSAQEILTCPLSQAVELVLGSIRMGTCEYMISEIDCFKVTRPQLNLAGSVLISNWTALSFQSADFGWGTPMDLGPVFMYENIVLVLSHGKEESINVILGLPIREMEVFELSRFK